MKFHELDFKKITETEVLEIIVENTKKRKFVITPLSILGLTGFPIAEQSKVLNNKDIIQKLKQILEDLETKKKLLRRKSKQGFKGIMEVGYDYVE